MPGAQFQILLGGKDSPLEAVLTDTIAGSLSGAFTAPTRRSLIVLCVAAQSSSSGSVSAATIGGHAAAIIRADGSSTYSSIAAAMVSPGDPNTFSITAPAPFSSRSAVFFYRVDGASRINVSQSSAQSGLTTPISSGVFNPPRNSTIIGIAKGQGSSSPPISFSLLTEDNEYDASGQSYAVAHKNYASAASSQQETVSLPGSSVSIASFAVFEP